MNLHIEKCPALKTTAKFTGKALVVLFTTIISTFLTSGRRSVHGSLQSMPQPRIILSNKTSLNGPRTTGPRHAEHISRTLPFCHKRCTAPPETRDNESMNALLKRILGIDPFHQNHPSLHPDRSTIRLSI